MRSKSSFLVMVLSCAAQFRLGAATKRASACDAGEVLPGFLRIRRQGHAIALLQRHAQLQRIDRVQAQAFDEQRRGRIDVVRADVLQRQGRDDQFLDLKLKWLHAGPPAKINGQMISQLSRGEGFAPAPIQERRNRRCLPERRLRHANAARRHAIPLLAFGQRHRLAADAHRGDVHARRARRCWRRRAAGGSARRARVRVPSGKMIRLLPARTSAMQSSTSAGAVVVEDVAGRAHRAAGEGVARQRRLDDAVGAAASSDIRNTTSIRVGWLARISRPLALQALARRAPRRSARRARASAR